MIFGKPELILKTKKVELRAPHYSDFEQWRHLRENSKTFLELWEPKRGNDFFKRKAFNNRVDGQKKVLRLTKRINFLFLIKLRLCLGQLLLKTSERARLTLLLWGIGWVRSIRERVL